MVQISSPSFENVPLFIEKSIDMFELQVGGLVAVDYTCASGPAFRSDEIQVESCFCDKSTFYEKKGYVAFNQR